MFVSDSKINICWTFSETILNKTCSPEIFATVQNSAGGYLRDHLFQLPCVSTNENHLKHDMDIEVARSFRHLWPCRCPCVSGTPDAMSVLTIHWVKRCRHTILWSSFCSINSNKTEWSSSFQYFQYFHSSIEKLANATQGVRKRGNGELGSRKAKV